MPTIDDRRELFQKFMREPVYFISHIRRTAYFSDPQIGVRKKPIGGIETVIDKDAPEIRMSVIEGHEIDKTTYDGL